MRRLCLIAGFLFVSFNCFAQKGYNIGDRGPAGGIVFYDKGSYSEGWRYMEAAPAETEFKARWGNPRNVSTSTGIGTGRQNTRLIGEGAAQQCAQLKIGGYCDWFLPSKDELNLMFDTLKQRGLDHFDLWYWSSSQIDAYSAWGQWFTYGGQDNGSKDSTYTVRAVRAF